MVFITWKRKKRKRKTHPSRLFIKHIEAAIKKNKNRTETGAKNIGRVDMSNIFYKNPY